ncbi:MAG: SDR family oxidoreductase [Lentisphaeria bacterium]|nr:SDR family oxidoreductase [Lentisphaeria bacterium]
MILQGKRVLVTGGGKRAGAVIVRKLAAAGCRVIIHCRESADTAQELCAALPGTGHMVVSADLADERAISDMLQRIGKFELLVNNAAIFHRPGSPEDLNAAELYDRINFRAPEKLLEYFFNQDISGGAAVNITDAFTLLPGSGAYHRSKEELNVLTRQLAPRWAVRGFRINAVAPGPMLPPPWAPESRMEKVLQEVPLHRAVPPEELAELVCFLLACDSMTGAVIPLDGGISVKNLTGC